MAMVYSIDPEAHLIRLVGTGRVTNEEMIECITAMRADPRLAPDMNTLSDMRDIEMGFSSDGVSDMLRVMEDTSGRRRSAKAAIVVSSEVAFGMGRMVQLYSEDRFEPAFRIFRDMDAALAWLASGTRLEPAGP